jgi:hypothetical protein
MLCVCPFRVRQSLAKVQAQCSYWNDLFHGTGGPSANLGAMTLSHHYGTGIGTSTCTVDRCGTTVVDGVYLRYGTGICVPYRYR